MYLRSFKKRNRRYYYIAKAVRIKERIVQKSILYIGTADKLYEKLKNLKKK